jgi:transcription elongation factor Elf1
MGAEEIQGRAEVTAALLRAGFVELVFHCPECGLGGTSLARPEALADRTCLVCGAPTVVTVLSRFSRGQEGGDHAHP